MKSRANYSEFSLDIGGEVVEVDEFTLNDWGISQEYQLVIHFRHQREDLAKTLPHYLSLHYYDLTHSGYLHRVEYEMRANDYAYKLTLVSPLVHLLKESDSATFEPQQSDEFIKQFLAGCKYLLPVKLDFEAKQTEWINQHNEVNFDFFMHWLARWDLFYHYRQKGSDIELVISANQNGFTKKSEQELFYHESAGLNDEPCVYGLCQAASLIPQTVVQRHYKREKAGMDEIQWQSLSGQGEIRQDSANQGSPYCLAANALVESNYLAVNFADIGFEPGQIIKVDDGSEILKQQYLRQVNIHGSQHLAQGSDSVESQKHLANPKVVTRLVMTQKAAPPRAKPRPDQGLAMAEIEAMGLYAQLDERGFYQIRHAYDEGKPQLDGSRKVHDKTKASGPVAHATPFHGPGYGFHHPLRDGTKVVTACEYGDSDKPIILGTIADEKTKPIVTRDNRYHNVLSTAGGNSLLIDDDPRESRVKLTTKDDEHRLTMHAPRYGKHQVELKSTGDINIKAEQGINVTAKEDLLTQVGANLLQRAKHFHEESSKESIKFHIKDRHSTRVKGTSKIECENLLIKAKRICRQSDKVQINVSGDMKLESKNGKVSIVSKNGAVHLNARKKITICQGSAKIELTADKLTIDAKKVTMKAQNIKGLSGATQVGANASNAGTASKGNYQVSRDDAIAPASTIEGVQHYLSQLTPKTLQALINNTLTKEALHEIEFFEAMTKLEQTISELEASERDKAMTSDSDEHDNDLDMITLLGSNFVKGETTSKSSTEKVTATGLPDCELKIEESQAVNKSTNHNGACWNTENTTTISLNLNIKFKSKVKSKLISQLKPKESLTAKLKKIVIKKIAVSTSMKVDKDGHVSMSTQLLPKGSKYEYNYNFGIDKKTKLPKLGASVTYKFEHHEIDTEYGKLTLDGKAKMSNDFMPKVYGICGYAIPTWRFINKHKVAIHGSIAIAATTAYAGPAVIASTANSSVILTGSITKIGTKLAKYGSAATAALAPASYAYASDDTNLYGEEATNPSGTLTAVYRTYHLEGERSD